jgi:hypothetical protein
MITVKFIHHANNGSFLSLTLSPLVLAETRQYLDYILEQLYWLVRSSLLTGPGFLSTSKDRRAPHITTTPPDVLLNVGVSSRNASSWHNLEDFWKEGGYWSGHRMQVLLSKLAMEYVSSSSAMMV